MRDAPSLIVTNEIYDRVSDITNVFDKSESIRRRSNANDINWRKRSICFICPIGKTCYCMNVCEYVLETLLNIDETINQKFRKMRIKDAFHLIRIDNGKIILPGACHIMSVRKKDMFCKVLHDLKILDWYSSNIYDV